MVHVWLRAETKPQEHRSALTPTTAKALLDAGFKVTVERSAERIFDDSEFQHAGCEMVKAGEWVNGPSDAFILGLKELQEDTFPLRHAHIYFAHCFKNQDGWRGILKRFVQGKGTLYDLEFLQHANGRRVAAFGYHAGFAGAAIGLDVWCHQQLASTETPYPAITPYPNETQLIDHIRQRLQEARAKSGRTPRVMVIGALGRCGTGATDLASRVGIPESNIIRWDMAETAKGGPFTEILEADVFVNCIYLSQPIPPFLTSDTLRQGQRALSVVVDVSCDPTNPHNPLPIYSAITTFDKPVIRHKDLAAAPPLDIVAIDHLPTLLPRESSEAFSHDLLPSLKQLNQVKQERVWTDAERLFTEKAAAAAAAAQS
ncbi:Saccharopine dehydrogenase [Sorochytrium milnesiophthora]